MRNPIGALARATRFAADGLQRLRARARFQRSGLFAALPLTGHVLEVAGGRGYLSEAAVHHIPNRRCTVVDAQRQRRVATDRRVRRRKFHRVCAAADRLPFGVGAFDAAWTAGAALPGLREMARVVRPGGALILIARPGFVPDPAALEEAGWTAARVHAAWLCRTIVARRG